MANGTPAPRSVAGGVDLKRAALSDAEAREVQEVLEHQLGVRCNGCGRRVTMGVKFTSLDPRRQPPVMAVVACSREECDFAERARDGATFMEMVEYAWLDASGVDAPVSAAVARREPERRPPGG